MHSRDWHNAYTRCFGLLLQGDNLQEYNVRGKRLVDDSFLFLINAHWESIPFVMPAGPHKTEWQLVFDTSRDPRDVRKPRIDLVATYLVKARSLVLLAQERPLPERKRKEEKDILSELVYVRPSEKEAPDTVYHLHTT
ncbi:MAG TPA: hypothetical protein PLP17_11950, partial [Oligoflexia bacterium]|nr:hypothetical protein [Oligoflexia bacterium]